MGFPVVWSRRARLLLAVAAAPSLMVLGLPGVVQAAPTGQATPAAATAAAVGQPPAAGATVAARPALGPTAGAGATEGRNLDIALGLVSGGAAVQVTITPLVDLPAATLQVLTAQGRQQLHRTQIGLGALRQGASVRRTAALAVPDGDVGVVAAVLAGQQVLGSQFVALRRHGGQILAAGSLAQLDDAALAADRQRGTLTGAAYARQVAQAHRAPGEAGTLAPTTLATTLTVSGTASYRDRNNIARPVRSGTVELVDSGGVVHISGSTRDDGSFTLSTSEVFGSMTVAVRISTQSAYGVVVQPNGSYWTAYSAPQTVTSGSTWSGVTIVLDRDSETNRGFAVLDQLRSLGAYYQAIRDPAWPVTRLGVRYPSGSRNSFTDSAHLISIAGGETLCTYSDGHTDWCPEDAHDWDVTAHESGHVVADLGGFAASPGGDHNVCDNAWGVRLPDGSVRGKDAAVKLAWSEGWATFYGVSALRLQPGVPSWAYPDAGDVSFNDRPGPPHNNTYRDVNYSLESADYCATTAQDSPHGDDSEMAISRALWDFWDPANDGETLAWSFGDILGRLKAARPTTFTAAWTALSNGRSASDLDQAGQVLETWGFAPTNLLPSGTVDDSLKRFSWIRGGIPAHPNDTFTLRVRSQATGSVLLQVTTAGTSYQPTDVAWEPIALAKNVIVDVSGGESTAPASGPFRSHGYLLTVQPAGWSGWHAFTYRDPNQFTTTIAPASWQSGRLDLFTMSPQQTLLHKWYNSGSVWSAWEDLGAPTAGTVTELWSEPAAVSWGPGRIDVFALDRAFHVRHKWYSGGWSGWEDLGGSFQWGDVFATSWGTGRLDVFTHDSTGALMHRRYVSGSGWSAWLQLFPYDSACRGGTQGVSWGTNRIDIFVACDGSTVYSMSHYWWDGTRWNGPQRFTDGRLSGGLAVSSRGTGRLDVFGVGTNQYLYHKWFQSGSGWSGWSSLGVPPAEAGGAGSIDMYPGAVSVRGTNRIDVFVTCGTCTYLWYHKWWG
jgi:hypothetical protein